MFVFTEAPSVNVLNVPGIPDPPQLAMRSNAEDTIEVDKAGLNDNSPESQKPRSSGRVRKSTWKQADVDPPRSKSSKNRTPRELKAASDKGKAREATPPSNSLATSKTVQHTELVNTPSLRSGRKRRLNNVDDLLPKPPTPSRSPTEAALGETPSQVSKRRKARISEALSSAPVITDEALKTSALVSTPLRGSAKKRGRAFEALPSKSSVADESPKSTALAKTPTSGRKKRRVNEILPSDKSTPNDAFEGTAIVDSTATGSGKKKGRLRNTILPISDALVEENTLNFKDIPKDKGLSSRSKKQKEQRVRADATTSRVPGPPEVSDPVNFLDPATQPPEEASDVIGLSTLLEDEVYEKHFDRLKLRILERIRGNESRISLTGLDAEYAKVSQIVKQTVITGEGNSMLIIGARGTGKTNLVQTVLAEMKRESDVDFYTVRLNGFIHTDDKLAIREIWRQLGSEQNDEERSSKGPISYADTLASLLALLSHKPESAAESQHEIAKSVVFIIDEFDLFTTHPRQTLLYNLFELAQSSSAPTLILGLTTKLNVVESLEKRVKSRFSHRTVHVSLPRSFPAFVDICRNGLVGPDPQDKESEDPEYKTLHRSWSAYVSKLFVDPTLSSLLRYIYAQTKSVPTFYATALVPIATMTTSSLPVASNFNTQNLALVYPKIHLLPSLSELELLLLISAARLDIVLDTDTCNFHMAYDEYSSLANRIRNQTSASGAIAISGSSSAGARLWGKDLALAAWETLEALELLVPATGTGAGTANQITSAAGASGRGRLYKVDVSLEEIAASGAAMNAMTLRWCKEI